MSIAIVGLALADSGAKFATAADPVLHERQGWAGPVEIKIDTKNGPVGVQAMTNGELAVHKLDRDDGWTITYIELGLRIHFGGRVFARSDGAMRMAELMLAVCPSWKGIFDESVPDVLRAARATVSKAYTEAEERGEILRDLVF